MSGVAEPGLYDLMRLTFYPQYSLTKDLWRPLYVDLAPTSRTAHGLGRARARVVSGEHWLFAAAYYGLSLARCAEKLLRVAAQRPLAWLHSEDAEVATDIANTYWHGDALAKASRLSEGMLFEPDGGSTRVSAADTSPLTTTTR